MAPPQTQHNCVRCGQPLRYIDAYGAWFCYVCQSYETPEVPQLNACPTCNQPLTYLEPYSAWYCYTCQKYELPTNQVTTYGMGSSYVATQPTTCSKCGRDLSGGQCYYCLADDMIAAAESSTESARQAGATTGKIDEKILHAKRLVADGKPDQAISIAEEAEDDAKEVREKHKTAKRLMAQLEDDLDKLAQNEVNTSTADNQLQLARNFLRSGNYEKTIEFLNKGLDWARQQAEKAGLKPKKGTVRVPRYSGSYPTCPECGNVVKKDQENCPYCEAPLFEEVTPEVAAQRTGKPVAPAVGDEEKAASEATLGLRSMMSEKDVGKVPVAPGVEAKPVIPVSPTKPVEPAKPAAKEGTCPNCGEDVEPEWTKCPFCSAAIGAKPAPPPKPVEAPKPTPPPPPKPVEAEKPGVVKCTSCGSDIEAGWKRCPVCMSPVKAAPSPPPKPVEAPKPTPPPPKPVEVQKPTPPPPKPVTGPPTVPPPKPADGKPGLPPPPPPPAGGPAKDQIEVELTGIETEVKTLEAKGINTAHAKNLIRLAQSFMKGGAPDKAQRYVRKARQAVDELKQDHA